jgi:polysaccharide deacetylase family protein (PEP-CTERM system associated)
MKNALTFDLEDYMHVSAFADHMPAAEWNDRVSRLEHNTDKLLEMLDSSRCSATFFVLGWVAQKYPQVIQRIASLGHEIACHSMWHRLVSDLTPAEFRADTQEAKTLLEDLSSQQVRGYRAPSFSITKKSWWAFEILRDLGFTYDSSIFPVKHPNYGAVEASRFPFVVRTESGNLVEFPLPTLQVGEKRAPFGGGAYFRILPYAYTRWGIKHMNDRETRPVCVYLHPWEIDGDQPRMKGRLTSRLRHYMGLRGTESKLRNLLRDFQFVPLEVLVEEWLARENSALPTSEVALPVGD